MSDETLDNVMATPAGASQSASSSVQQDAGGKEVLAPAPKASIPASAEEPETPAPASPPSAGANSDDPREPLDSRLAVEFSDRHMEAWIRLKNPQDQGPVSVEEITASLNEAKIVGEDPENVLACVAAMADLENRPDKFLIAEGKAVVEGQDGEFIWDDALEQQRKDWQDDEAIDYHNLSAIVTVDEGTSLGRLTPPVPGENGVDVHGRVLEPTRSPSEVNVGDGVRLSEQDPQVAIADTPGRVVHKANELSIVEVLDIKGDVDFESGNIDSTIDVNIRGTIREGFVVKSKKSVFVGGAIEAGEVRAGGDVMVRGGILGRGGGIVEAGGEITAKFAEEANLVAEGDVSIGKEIMSGTVNTHGRLNAAHGDVIGGVIHARQGAEIRSIGNEAHVQTRLTIGIHPDIVRQAEKVKEELKSKGGAAEKIRRTLQPLMANMKRLTSDQKERATELLYEAESMEADVADSERKMTEMLENAGATDAPSVVLSKMIYPKTHIGIGRKEVLFKKALPGPVKIEERKVGNAVEFVAVNQLTGSITVLPSFCFLDEPAEPDPE